MPEKRRVIRTLGEVALRCEDLAVMREFYEQIVGLEFWISFEVGCFFRIGPDFGGHTQVLGLFDRSYVEGYQGVGQEKTPLDHLAFTIDIADLAAEKARLEGLGLQVIEKEHIGFSWRALFFKDPEGNTVELVAYDSRVPGQES
jgi:catechol-2,3-dioxygenase